MMKKSLLLPLLIAVISSCTGSIKTGVRDSAIRDAAKSLSATGDKNGIKKIAILGFEITGTSDTGYSGYISEKLTHELVTAGRYSVVERSKIDKIIKEQNLWRTGIIDFDSAIRIGKILSVDGIVFGTIRAHRDKIELFAKLVNSETGLIVKSVSVSFRDNPLSSTSVPPGKKPFHEQNTGFPDSSISGRVNIPAEKPPSARLLHVDLFRSGKSILAIGELKNTGGIDIARARISFKLLDNGNNLITVINAYTDRHIKPGETLPFSGFLTSAPASYSSYQVVFEPEAARYFTYYTNLKSSQERFIKDGYSGYTLSGIVTNLNGIKIQYPHIIVSLYNKKGEFIGKAGGYASLRRLKISASSPYTVNIYGLFLKSKPESYRLHFSSLKDNR